MHIRLLVLTIGKSRILYKKKYLIAAIVLLYSIISANSQIDSTKKINFAALPYLDYDNTFGLTLGALGQAFYKINAKDTISPTSTTGLFGMYTTNNSYFATFFEQIYFDEDKWRIMIAAGVGDINFQYWQSLPIVDGLFINFGTKVSFAMAQIQRKIYGQLYGGVNGFYTKAHTAFDLPDWVPDSLKGEVVNLNNIGYLFNFDKREHQMNPYGGYNIEFKHSIYDKWLYSDYNFQSIELTYNHYYRIENTRNILATRVKANISTGDVPFQGQNVVGQDDIRGYSSGKYRNNQVYAVQAEYRWRFYKKLGMVGFLGFATAVETLSEIPSQEILPGIGTGLRYLMIEKERINVGIDAALGKDDWGLYFRIGESFGR